MNLPHPFFKMNILTAATALIALHLHLPVQSQPVNAILQVLPPYSPYLSDYTSQPNRMVLTLVNLSPQPLEVALLASVRGDNGVSAYTQQDYRPPQPIVLQPNGTLSLTGVLLAPLFDLGQMEFVNLDIQQVEHSGLMPEGNYVVCITAVDYQTGQPLSAPEPAGCSNLFSIQYLEPPIVTYPVCGDTLDLPVGQPLVFTWTTPPGASPNLLYTFTLVEVMPENRPPADALASATTPPLVEARVTGNVLVYTNAYPPLQPGMNYAFDVQVEDPATALVFTNAGNSEPCSFFNRGEAQPGGGTTTQPNVSQCACESAPEIKRVKTDGDNWTYEAWGKFSCSGYCPAGGGDAEECLKKDISFSWEITSGNDVAEIIPQADAARCLVHTLKPGSFVLWLHTKTTCTCAGCEGSDNTEETVPPPTTIAGGGCECHCDVVVKPEKKEGSRWTYKATAKGECKGLAGTGDTRAKCEVKDIKLAWHIGEGSDPGVAEIDGATDKDSCAVNIKGAGQFTLYCCATVTCTDGSNCTCCGNVEETVHDTPPPSDCLCGIASKLFGATAIKVTSPLAARVFSDADQGLAVGLSVLATDEDQIIQDCILGGVRQRLIEHVGDLVNYDWKKTGDAGGELLSADGNSTLLVLPPGLKKDEKWEAFLTCTITSAEDDPIEGKATITVTGADACERYSVKVETVAFTKGKDKTATLTNAGNCFPKKETWEPFKGVTATWKTTTKNVQRGQVAFFQIEATDVDKIILYCKSDRCGNPNKEVFPQEDLTFSWSDGGAGGKFLPVDNGKSVIYLAPDTARAVTISCLIKDRGNHPDGAEEKTNLETSLQVQDALTELNLSPTDGKKSWLTAGVSCFLNPVWLVNPAIEAHRVDWCLDLGGNTDGKAAVFKTSSTAMKKEDAKLHLNPGVEKDDGLTISWQQHHHLHGKYALTHRTTFRFKAEKIIYTDHRWIKSNFLEGATVDSFRLFFNKNAISTADNRDDGKWRSGKVQDDDYYGKPATLLNGTKPPEWVLHWAGDTYAPCDLPPDFLFRLDRTDPKFVYYDVIPKPKNQPDTWKAPLAEYRSLAGENTVYLSKGVAEPYKRELGLPPTNPKWETSDKKKFRADLVVSLPALDMVGVEAFAKEVAHELAHWQSITKNWKAGGDWQAEYGTHTSSVVYEDLQQTVVGELKDVTFVPAQRVMEFDIRVNSNLTVKGKDVKKADDVGKKYSLTLDFKIPTNDPAFFNSAHIEVSSGWFEDGKLKANNKEFNGNVNFWSEHNTVVQCTFTDNTKYPPTTTSHTSRNGIVLTIVGTKVNVYERHNDLDGDFLPNLLEDSIGLNWKRYVSYSGGDYHGDCDIPYNCNDQEFWAEWATKFMVDEKTGKVKKGICDPKKDWANPGLQTK
ncbi:MAG: hypothetical protein EPO28_12680 [Saprospiraceae bacterium]|nr:MAG: hypothetical protein EPO28_12680 [Saprospiraceae bacterium]